MRSSANEQSTEVGCVTEQETSPGISKSPVRPEDEEEEEEEDEEEDVDFNPFLKGTPSPEASSSLSSEIVGDCEHDEEEITTQATVSPNGACDEGKRCHKDFARKNKKRKSLLISQPEEKTIQEKENGSTSSGIDVNDCMVGDLSNAIHSRKPILDLDDEDAICRRTRARYSLASFTLDELEAFLQETDDDDDLQNVDDEEEYRKFLAAVLQGGDGDDQSSQENENIDDEDEDNDADFEIELEEMLESDYDEGTADKTQKEEFVRAIRRPETRQNRRQKASAQYKKKLLEQSKRPLRPLLPVLPNVPQIAPFSIFEGETLMPETSPSCPSLTTQDALINGFAPHQIGQLYCLIHEHVQLLIQVFSLCILDTSRQNIAHQVQGLIFEMLHKRDETRAFRNEPYPEIYFRPPYICSSVPDAHPQFGFDQGTFGSSSSFDAPGVSSPPDIEMSAFQNISTSEGSCGHVSNFQAGSVSVKGSSWVPSVSGLVLSVLDVAPLNLVGKYVDDAYTAVQEHRQRCLASGSDICFQREPLFPFPSFASLIEANSEVYKGRILPTANTITSSPSRQPPKRSLAAALVESTKKQSVALVPKEISKLARRFFPLFNPSLFPHKPPPPSVANRVLFTDAEDKLLALGMMEYNTDWKAIQQRFLPCKSKHQIFVRQKNRCSSKAPENPIKAVRRMKTSPLTAKEIESIQEGLKVFKLDWMSVWKFVVPHRDPSLLRRQWRIALGTQKCYKQDATKKEKRRLYELKRRCKTADLANWHLDSDKEVENAGGVINGADGYIENTQEGYVHEGFLADWRPGVYNQGSSGNPCINLGDKHPSCGILLREGTHVGEEPHNFVSDGAHPPTNNMHEHPYALNRSQDLYPSHLTHVRHDVLNSMQPNHPVPNMASKTSKSQVCLPPYRAHRSNNAHLVKLAPDLPPVNLPPSVRVIPQSAFKSVQCGSSVKVSAAESNAGHSGSQHLVMAGRDKRNTMTENVVNSHLEESHVVQEERGTQPDLQMHPLLFQAPEDGRLPYYPLNCSASTSSSFSFFSGNQPQLNLSLFHNPRQLSHALSCFNKSLKTKESTSGSCVIDFHPLLKRTEGANNNLATTPSNARISVGSERKSDQHKNPFDTLQSKTSVSNGPFAANSIPSSINEKSSELDLEIHLSSSSAKERALGNREMAPHNLMQSMTVANSGDKTETQNKDSLHYQYGENCSQVASNGHFSIQTTGNIDDIGDHSHPEIVMEQEELSDSDEEIEEHVEFECEEMTDSEGEEGSGCEQIAEMQEKEVPSLVTEKATDGDSDDQQHELRSSHGLCGAPASRKGSSPFLKLGLTNLGKDTASSSWLSLNSSAPGNPICTKSKNSEDSISEGPAAKIMASRPIRSCKKVSPSSKKVATQMHATDMTEQLSLSSLAVQTVRKKRGCRTNTGLNIRTTDDKD